ncbi:MAG: hypothetical protein OXG79_13190 [Chloroflexi bacterium]|nr:hypothetical protein [Chloroflexota bacterium]
MFLALNVILAVVSALAEWGDSPASQEVILNREQTAANLYAAIIWGAVAVLAGAQLFRSATPVRGPKWLGALGWLSVALLAALVAAEELTQLKDRLGYHQALQASMNLSDVPPRDRWLPMVAPLVALLAATASWGAYPTLRRHPALALLTGVAVTVGLGAVLRDVFAGTQYMSPVGKHFLEEGSELMAGATLVVVLVELLAARAEPARRSREMSMGGRGGRWATLVATAALLAAGAFVLLAEFNREDSRRPPDVPWTYAGPISLVEQRIRATHDRWHRITVWAYVDGSGDPETASADIFARLTPADGSSPGPVRESRAEVRGARFSNATVDFDFAPIPDSGGKLYTLAVGVLSGPEPYVFLGITHDDAIPEGEIVIAGVATGYGNDLALRTYWTARGRDLAGEVLAQWLPLVDGAATSFLWLFPIAAAWSGLSLGRSRFWRDYAWPAAWCSVLILASLVAVILAVLPVLAAGG